MAKNNNKRFAALSEDIAPQAGDLVIGRTYSCGVHSLTVKKVEAHFGNLQVCYYDAFDQKVRWEHIGTFHKMLEKKDISV